MGKAIEKKETQRVKEPPKEYLEAAAHYLWLKQACPTSDGLKDWMEVEDGSQSDLD